MNYQNRRLCMWTTAIQGAMVDRVAEELHCSKSQATALCVRRGLMAMREDKNAFGHVLEEAYALLMKRPVAAAKELSTDKVREAIDKDYYDDIPF